MSNLLDGKVESGTSNSAMTDSTSSTTSTNWVKKKNGVIMVKKTKPLPVESLRHLVAVGTIQGTATVDIDIDSETPQTKTNGKHDDTESDSDDKDDDNDDKDTEMSSSTSTSGCKSTRTSLPTTAATEVVPLSTVLYQQIPKTQIEADWLRDDIRRQMGLWFLDSARSRFTKELLCFAYKLLYKHKLQVVLIDAQDTKSKCPSFDTKVKRISPRDFPKMEKLLGKQIRELIHLPDKLNDSWFPLILIHKHIYETLTNQDPLLQNTTYISFTLIPYPESEDDWCKKWSDQQIQAHVTDFLMNQPPIEIKSAIDIAIALQKAAKAKKKKRTTKRLTQQSHT